MFTVLLTEFSVLIILIQFLGIYVYTMINSADGFGEKPEQTGHQFYGIKYQIYNGIIIWYEI
jgi:hypothetical protein